MHKPWEDIPEPRDFFDIVDEQRDLMLDAESARVYQEQKDKEKQDGKLG